MYSEATMEISHVSASRRRWLVVRAPRQTVEFLCDHVPDFNETSKIATLPATKLNEQGFFATCTVAVN